MISLLAVILTACSASIQNGFSTDNAYGYDVGPIWGHLYLVNDHTTAYCFKPDTYGQLIKDSIKNKQKLDVYYQKYVGMAPTGALCTPPDNMEAVVVTNIEISK